MDGVLSQEEINALLNNPGGAEASSSSSSGGSASGTEVLTPEEIDAIGEN